MNPLQKLVILLDVPPFTAVFGALYRAGLNRLLAGLARLECVHAVYGCGSFFEGRPLYGLSDIDLAIVIDERFSRLDLELQEVVRTYARARRWFPFLGRWDEKAENLIFLSEVALGFSLPESFRLRAKLERRRRGCSGPSRRSTGATPGTSPGCPFPASTSKTTSS